MAGSSEQVYSNANPDVGASPYNVLMFMVQNTVKGMVNTAIPCVVNSCTAPGPDGAAGYVSATPLVSQRGSDGSALPPVALPKLPFYRAQCGEAAVVMDPKPGDIGLAVFAQQDCSNVVTGQSASTTPGSLRSYSMADGFFIGGFVNKPPKTFIHLDDDGKEIRLRAEAKIVLDTPLVELKGVLVQTGELMAGRGSSFKNGFTNTGGSITTNGVTVETHTHYGVDSGNDNTGSPNHGS